VADAQTRQGASAPGTDAPRQSLTVLGAAFLGVGAMVGAGIFALLCQAGTVAGAAVWISLLLAGGIAALLGYVVVKLGVAIRRRAASSPIWSRRSATGASPASPRGCSISSC
jgi:amino acid transporter